MKAAIKFCGEASCKPSDLAQQLIKDFNEQRLETALTGHITTFLLELGAGVAYVERQQ